MSDLFIRYFGLGGMTPALEMEAVVHGALAVMALGLGGVLAALLAQARGFSISAMSVSLSVLLFGVFALLEQQGIKPFAGETWVYAALLAAWGAYELRPSSSSR